MKVDQLERGFAGAVTGVGVLVASVLARAREMHPLANSHKILIFSFFIRYSKRSMGPENVSKHISKAFGGINRSSGSFSNG